MVKDLRKVAIVGTGPAALMAATVLTSSKFQVSIYEKKPGPGRKLLIAGSSGLNITNALPPIDFAKQYSGDSSYWENLLKKFGPAEWLEFIHSLGFETFKGTSDRYFVREMKASKLLRAWTESLSKNRVVFKFEHEVSSLKIENEKFTLGDNERFDAVCFALGGGSYEPKEKPLRWPALFSNLGIQINPFLPSNVGYQVEWKKEFLTEAEGHPLKHTVLTTSRGSKAGELIFTNYGIEGTPVYTVGCAGLAHLDLQPNLSEEKIRARLNLSKENLSPIRRAKKFLGLSPSANALLFHHGGDVSDLEALARLIKKFPILIGEPQPLDEAISSSGGLAMDEIDENFMLKKIPGVFCAGEMLDWDAPTGGFLIQGCVSQGYAAARGLIRWTQSQQSHE